MKKKETIILSIFAILKSIFSVALVLIVKILIDLATNHDEKVYVALIVFASTVIFTIFLYVFAQYLKNKYALSLELNLKRTIYSSLLKKEVSKIQKFHSGEIENLYYADVNRVVGGLVDSFPSAALLISRFVFSLVALAIIDYRFLLGILVFGLFFVGFGYFYSKKYKKYQKRAIESDAEINKFMLESFSNLKLLKSLNSENRALERNNDDLKNNEIIKRKRNNFSLIGSSGLLIFLRIVYLGTFVYGALMIFNGQLSYGSLTGLIQLVSFIEGPLTNFNAIINSYNSFKISKERIDEVLNLQDEVKQVELSDFDEIIFKNVSFSYENNQIFKNFNYTINKNDSILIKGKSGRGKSTLFNLLLGFVEPDEGEILVRYKNQTYSIKETRTLFSLVNQDNILFSGSVRDNIYLLSEERDEDKIIGALKIANIYDELMEKKNKLDTKLIERGGGLSLGQIQRVALAISILNNKKILLLDEFTSSLDPKLEENIVLSISKLEKTKLIITHHNIEIDGSKVLNLDYE